MTGKEFREHFEHMAAEAAGQMEAMTLAERERYVFRIMVAAYNNGRHDTERGTPHAISLH